MAKKTNELRTVCGVTPEEIRKLYFSGKLGELFAAIQAEGKWADRDVRELGAELQSLKDGEVSFVDVVKEIYSGAVRVSDEVKEPSIAELTRELTEEEEAQMVQWREERDKAVKLARHIISKTAKAAMTGAVIQKNVLMDDAHAMTGLMLFLGDDKTYKKVMLVRKQFELKEKYGGTRKEAEDRAMVTQEYIDYRKASHIMELADQLVMNCKKEFGAQNR